MLPSDAIFEEAWNVLYDKNQSNSVKRKIADRFAKPGYIVRQMCTPLKAGISTPSAPVKCGDIFYGPIYG